MRRFLFLLCLVLVVPTFHGCSSTPNERTAYVQTLKAVGATAESAVSLSAQLYRDGRITPAQAREVADFYDKKFQPVFRLAVSTAKADISTVASPDLVALASQLASLVTSLTK